MLPAVGTPELREIAGTLDELQGLVGGCIECVTIGDGAHLYIDDEGKFKDVPTVNRVASSLVEHYFPGFLNRDVIVGNAIVLGSTDDGNEADVPVAILALLGLETA